MPGKQKDTRTRITIALEKELEREIQAEMERRKAKGEKADKSGVIADAIAWFLRNGAKVVFIDALARFLFGSDPMSALLAGLCDVADCVTFAGKAFFALI